MIRTKQIADAIVTGGTVGCYVASIGKHARLPIVPGLYSYAPGYAGVGFGGGGCTCGGAPGWW